MRVKSVTERYRAVSEGTMSKKEFVRQMRQQYPMHITQFNGFDDSVQILKNRGLLFETKNEVVEESKTYDDRPALNYSLDALDRGIRAELGDNVKPTYAEFQTAEKKAKSNLEKNPTHYLDLLSGESSHVDKHDREEEVKRGEAKKDVFNGEKKADLRENIESARDNIIRVASVIRGKYGEIPGFTSILKDFLQTHQDDIKAGEVTDPIAEFDDFIDLNYDRLDEKEGKDLDGDGDIDSDDYLAAKDKAIKKAMGKDEVVSEMSPEMADVVAFLATGAGIQGASHVAGKLIKALETGRFGEKGKEIAQDIHNLAKTDVEEGQINERGFHVMRQIKSIIQDMAADFDGDEVGAAEELMEAIGQEYGIDFEFGAGPSRQAEAKNDHIKESIKNIITKVLQEQVINEAATAELARLADDYAGFEGMKSAILDLQNIVTDIESFYDKTREKIQKVYNSIGEIRNEEGLKVGGFLAPTIESAFNKDLRPAVKRGFTSGLETPKVKTLSQADIDAARERGEIEEEPKQTLFTPIAESKKK